MKNKIYKTRGTFFKLWNRRIPDGKNIEFFAVEYKFYPDLGEYIVLLETLTEMECYFHHPAIRSRMSEKEVFLAKILFNGKIFYMKHNDLLNHFTPCK